MIVQGGEHLPPGWAWATIEQLASDERNAITDGPFGSNLKTSHYTSGGPRVIRLQNIGDGVFVDAKAHISQEHFETLTKHWVAAGDIVIAALGETLPRSCVVPPWVGPALVKAVCIRFKPNDLLALPKFLNFALNSESTRDRVSSIVHGVGRPRLNLGEVKSIVLPVAPLPEQRRIVAAIETQFTRLDASVAALERARANLKRYRAAVSKAACEGRLVPTEAELARAEGRGYEPASVLLERIAAERDDVGAHGGAPTVDGGRRGNRSRAHRRAPLQVAVDLPTLPEGWCWAHLSALAELVGGITKGQKRRPSDVVRAVPYLRVANVQRGCLDLTEVKYIEATETEIATLRLKPGDVLFNEGGDRDKLGRGWVWNGEIPDCIHQNHVFRARFYGEGISPKIVSWYGNTFAKSISWMRESKRQI